jgi:flagellar protein FliS
MTYATRRPQDCRSAAAYATVGLETQVLSASPVRLVTLMFGGARGAIAQARIHLEHGRTAERGMAISKAIRIVSEGLRQSLDMKAGGEIAATLDDLYDYILRSLLEANLKSDVKALNIADRLLADLEQTWTTSVDLQPQQA